MRPRGGPERVVDVQTEQRRAQLLSGDEELWISIDELRGIRVDQIAEFR
jgi:hypothetical protein